MRGSPSRKIVECDFRVAVWMVVLGFRFLRVYQLSNGENVFQFRDEMPQVEDGPRKANPEDFWQRAQNAARYLQKRIKLLKRKKRLAE
jgi:hypothetical protein